MTSMYGAFKTDDSLETKGVVIDYGQFRVTIARAGGANKRFATLLAAKTQPYRRAIQTETLPDEVADRIQAELYAEAIVLNWEVKQEDGSYRKGIASPANEAELLKFSTKTVADTLLALPELFIDIKQQAARVALFREAVDEGDSGNS